MGLLDRFRKSKSDVSLPQLCYDVAYFVLPHYAFNDLKKLTELCLNAPPAAGPFVFLLAAKARGVEPDMEDAKRLHWHHGAFSEGCEYFALEFPRPPAIDLSAAKPEQVVGPHANIVLAPHFSVIVRGPERVQYFILGQAPIGGGTTLRCITPEGANCNLGPGPAAKLSSFLDSVRAEVESNI